MKLMLKYFLIITIFSLVIPAFGFAEPPVLKETICYNDSYSEYTNAEYRASKSDGVCNSGTQLDHILTDDDGIVESVELERLNMDDDGHRVKVKVNWKGEKTGTVLIEVRFRRRHHNGAFCEWRDWSKLYTYEIKRESLNPGGTLNGEDLYLTTGSSPVNINLQYDKSEVYPFQVNGVRYRVNGQTPRNASKISGTNSSFRLNFSAPGIGEYNFTTEVYNNCEEWMPGPSKRVTVKPTCWNDSPGSTVLQINGQEPLKDGGFSLKKGATYSLTYPGITDFTSHYELKHDGGDDITLTGSKFTVHKGLGSYRIEAVRKGGREECNSLEPLLIFVGGHDVTLEQPCLITLPGTIIDFGYKVEPDDPALKHFAATVRSKKGIIVKPGITLAMGAELILDYEEPVVDTLELNPDMNFIQTTSYDEYGRVAGQSRQFFDKQGRPVQSQYKDLSRDVLMASQAIYDAYGRPVVNTLTAPIEAGTYTLKEDPCGDTVQTGAKVRFTYNPNFVTDSEDKPYTYINFDLEKEQSPDPVGTTEGTLGWYYSSNNGSSVNDSINERFVAVTAYPYSRVLYHHDGSGEVKSATSPGDIFKAGAGHLGESNREKVTNDDQYLNNYLEIRKTELGLSHPEGLLYEGSFFKSVAIDAHGKKAVSYQDWGGNTIISLYFGSQQVPVTRSYQFYNDRGQLVVSLSPNGWKEYTGGTAFNEADRTTYIYDAKGRLVEMNETDAGQTQYVYRKDGSIRFSQNAEQASHPEVSKRRFSYTNYDDSGRPVESGEYQPGSITFKSSQMDDILEDLAPDGDLLNKSGTKTDRILTFYDLPDPEGPQGRVQRFVQGAVSYSKKENIITTWYSYDERGRVEWMVQQITGLGNKSLDYRYGPTGAVQEVAYQKGEPEEDFYHYYEYDADGRLVKAYTATEELLYNIQGELTNRGALQEQAAYEYYLHGPLKRVALAGNLQGIDYIYTASGALKGINHADINKDPGNDGANGFREDVFGMTLVYFNNDYQGAEYNAGTLNTASTPEQFTGNIRAQSWHSPVDGGEQVTYAYSYDDRYQLQDAKWKSNTEEPGEYTEGAYQESVSSYDLNGNIVGLGRKDGKGIGMANFNYHYKANSNKLFQVKQGEQVFREYEYNELGQMTSQFEGEDQMHLQYDVTGKVTGVYKAFDAGTQEYSRPVALYTYDDRGFRLSKTTYDEDGKELPLSWYVRDASGSLLSTYTQKQGDIQQEELPIYGANKIGIYRPNALINKYMYELTDHLGNVRAVVGEPAEVEYLATMEAESPEVAGRFFDNIDPVVTDERFINHTPPKVTLNGINHTIPDPDQVIRINNALDNPKKVIGGAIMLPVFAGDEIKAEVFAKYVDFDKGKTNILPGLAGYLGTAFGISAGGDGLANIFDVVELPGSMAYNALGNASEDYPRIFLNYILFDRNFMIEDFGLVQVSDAAEIPESNPELHLHEMLELEVTIKKGGYIYLYVSNDDGQNMDAYFDDFRVVHKYSDVVAGSDYYPFGLAIEEREITREDYRYGYQGKYSEKDKETGWNSFELRMYDPIISRWMSVDPARQYASPYKAMGNNPINGVDPDGAFNQGVDGDGNVVFDDGLDDGNVFLVYAGFTGKISDLATLQANSTQIFRSHEFIGTSTQMENYVLSQFKFTGLQSFHNVSTNIDAKMNGLSVASRESRIGANGDFEVRGKPYADWAFSIYSAKGIKSTLFSNVYNLRNALEHESYHVIQTIGIMHNYNDWKSFASERAYKTWSEHGAINYQRNHKSFNLTTPGYQKSVQRYYNYYK